MASNPYTSQSISGYNAGPPPDDGSKTSANQLEWAKHKTKLGDPLKTFAEAIDSAVSAAFDSLLITTDPAEETSIVAMEEFIAAALASSVSRAKSAVSADRATGADSADDLTTPTENVVVMMQEYM